MQKTTLLSRFLIWRIKHISNRQFILMLSLIVGLTVGVAAYIIKSSVHLIQTLLTKGFPKEYNSYLYLIFPTIGIFFVAFFIKYILKQRVGHGIPGVLHAISKTNGKIKPHNIFSSVISSAFTVGFGGSVGLEGPTVATGAAIGSNLGRLFHLNYKQIILLLGCASAGAMAAIFKAPIAAIVFALEVIMINLTMSSIVPILISSVTAAVTTYALRGQNVLYQFELKEKFVITMADIPLYIILGIIAGLVSVYFTRIYMFTGRQFDKIKKSRHRLLVGGILLGILIFFFPALYGEGYEVINSCLDGNYNYLFEDSLFTSFQDSLPIIFILLSVMIILKVIAASITFGSGGIGGIFAPTLFMGANLGLLFAKIFNNFNTHQITQSHFALLGMAGLIAGVLHAPLTATFLIAEITNGFQLLVPLMIVATISYATIRLFEKNSVYTIQLAKRGELITHDKDKAALSLMKVEKLIEKNIKTIGPDKTLGDLVQVIAKSNRNIFAVIDEEKTLLGIIYLDHIRHIIFDREMYDDTYVRNLMVAPSTYVSIDDTMEGVVKKFQNSGFFNLPVVKDGKYLGFVSKATVYSSYRQKLKLFSED